MVLLTLLKYAVALGAVGCFASCIHVYFFSPLCHIPGPFWARFTNLWYFIHVSRGSFQHENIALHKKYGPVVRLGPRLYSIDSPDAVSAIYGVSAKMPKSSWYDGVRPPAKEQWTLFAERDIPKHAAARKLFTGLYSMSSLVSYEGYVDECGVLLKEKLGKFADDKQQELNLAKWLQCYAFDVIGNMTFSGRFGFLDEGKDISGILEALHASMQFSALVGIIPSLHSIVFALLNQFKLGGPAGLAHLIRYVQDRIAQRRSSRDTASTEKSISLDGDAPQDFLDKMIIANEKDPKKVTPYHIFMIGLSNVFAGADTTAITLSAIMYYLMQKPDVMERLRREVDEHLQNGGDSIPFKVGNELPYLQAVIKEGMRLHAATGLPMWRVVPKQGLELEGVHFPAESEVGLNTWVAHYNEDVFGSDARAFRPERWLEEKDADKLKAINAYYCPVGPPTPIMIMSTNICLANTHSLAWARERAWDEPLRSWK